MGKRSMMIGVDEKFTELAGFAPHETEEALDYFKYVINRLEELLERLEKEEERE